MHETLQTVVTAPRKTFQRRLFAAGLSLALAAGAASPGFAQSGSPGPPGSGLDGPDAMMGDPAHLGRMADHLLKGLDVSEAQRTQVRQIAQAAVADMKPQQEARRALHEKSLQLMAAPTLDAAAAEALRQQMLAQRDQASKRMLQAMLDIGRVLTPEQRVALAERMKQRHEAQREHMPRGPRPAEQKG